MTDANIRAVAAAGAATAPSQAPERRAAHPHRRYPCGHRHNYHAAIGRTNYLNPGAQLHTHNLARASVAIRIRLSKICVPLHHCPVSNSTFVYGGTSVDLLGTPMREFHRIAFFLLVWRSFLAVLITIVVTVLHGFEPAASFRIAAGAALLFSLGLILHAVVLTDDRIVRTEAWREFGSADQSAGAPGRQCARNILRELSLRFAKASSAIAIAFASLALVSLPN